MGKARERVEEICRNGENANFDAVNGPKGLAASHIAGGSLLADYQRTSIKEFVVKKEAGGEAEDIS